MKTKTLAKSRMITAIMDRETQWVSDAFTAAHLPNPQAIRRAELRALPITEVRTKYYAALARKPRNVLGRY